jgi:hypothetical protein
LIASGSFGPQGSLSKSIRLEALQQNFSAEFLVTQVTAPTPTVLNMSPQTKAIYEVTHLHGSNHWRRIGTATVNPDGNTSLCFDVALPNPEINASIVVCEPKTHWELIGQLVESALATRLVSDNTPPSSANLLKALAAWSDADLGSLLGTWWPAAECAAIRAIVQNRLKQAQHERASVAT